MKSIIFAENCIINLSMSSRNTIDFFTASNNLFAQQDTVKTKTNLKTNLSFDSLPQKKVNLQKTAPYRTIQQLNFSEIDSIVRKSEERETQLQAQIQEQLQREAAIQRWLRRQHDTTEILYKEFGIARFPIKENLDNDLMQQNFLYNFLSIKPEEKQKENIVFVENEKSTFKDAHTTEQIEKHKIIPKNISGRIQFDWITIILLASILLLGWVQLFNRKYLLTLIKSSLSFPDSITLYREKNSLMEKASFMINLLFLSNISLFIIQVCTFYGAEFNIIENYIFYLILLGAFVSLFIFRALTSSFIGILFLKQKVFSEFFHNVNIYTKNIGLFILPIVIILQFLSYEYLPIIVYSGILMICIFYILHLVRAFQIIIRKNVSISYMILYLCAFEFAPFLIIYKIAIALI